MWGRFLHLTLTTSTTQPSTTHPAIAKSQTKLINTNNATVPTAIHMTYWRRLPGLQASQPQTDPIRSPGDAVDQAVDEQPVDQVVQPRDLP